MEEGKKERGTSKASGATRAPSGGTSVGSSMQFGSGPSESSGDKSTAGDKPASGPGSAMGGGRARRDGNGDGNGPHHFGDDAEEMMESTRGMVGQLFGDVRSAAEDMLEERKERAAESVQGVADALRRTADSLKDENEAIARYAEQAADTVERLSSTVRERRLGEMIADIDHFARRQPMLFVLGAVAAGFVAGRFMAASAERQHAESWGGEERRREVRTRTAGYGRGGDFGTKGNA